MRARTLATVVSVFLILGIELSFLPHATAQSSPLQDLRITITDYEAEKVMPGSTLKVRFTVHKPAGIKITDSVLSARAYYEVDDEIVWVMYTGSSGRTKTFSLPSLDEQDVNQELEIKILENAPVDQLIYVSIQWSIANVHVVISENENQVSVTIGDNTITAPIVSASEYSGFTSYNIVDGFANWVRVRSDESDRLYVFNRVDNVKMLPRPLEVLYVIAAVVGVAILCVAVGIFMYYKKKRRGGGVNDLEDSRDTSY